MSKRASSDTGADAKKAKVDKEIELCISFDTTASMFPCLGEVRRKVADLVGRLLADIPHMKIALVVHGDYEFDGNPQPDPYVLKKLNFSCDIPTLQAFVNGAERTWGKDMTECYEYVLREVQSLSWSPASSDKQRLLVMIGDCTPHELQDAGRGGRFGDRNPHSIDWRAELQKLREMDIRVHGVQALNRSYATPFWKELASTTGGVHLELDQFASIRDLILSVAYSENSLAQLSEFESEVIDNGRMTRSMTRMFDMLHGREASAATAVPAGLDAVPPGRFQVLEVDDTAPIKEFALSHGLAFKVGRGFYQFTKPEKIAVTKEIVLRDKATGDFFTGPKAKQLLGITAATGKAKLKVADLAEYLVFVQSKSYNRKLVSGTSFLYEVDPDQ